MLRAMEMAGAALAYRALQHVPFALDLDDTDIIEYAERRAHFVQRQRLQPHIPAALR